ncbi:hypothetical protein JCM1393_08780 [Clostridium carnis]
MKKGKGLGSILLALSAIFVTAGVASAMTIGVEDMPESIKNKR